MQFNIYYTSTALYIDGKACTKLPPHVIISAHKFFEYTGFFQDS